MCVWCVCVCVRVYTMHKSAESRIFSVTHYSSGIDMEFADSIEKEEVIANNKRRYLLKLFRLRAQYTVSESVWERSSKEESTTSEILKNWTERKLSIE